MKTEKQAGKMKTKWRKYIKTGVTYSKPTAEIVFLELLPINTGTGTRTHET
jgi:hypothetical protein